MLRHLAPSRVYEELSNQGRAEQDHLSSVEALPAHETCMDQHAHFAEEEQCTDVDARAEDDHHANVESFEEEQHDFRASHAHPLEGENG